MSWENDVSYSTAGRCTGECEDIPKSARCEGLFHQAGFFDTCRAEPLESIQESKESSAPATVLDCTNINAAAEHTYSMEPMRQGIKLNADFAATSHSAASS
ncbi:hypothetical protein CGC21_10060 [Leishmania donovani]|uniref:Uncharacterized protein n=1 Tax=Leishmania donovani TaxID=5661 RepID=A0A504XUQ9_LEIDO|nr:hypothetical protein CGC21_10060 [Leishmania donovani]